MTELAAAEWEHLMDQVVDEALLADYTPGQNTAPGDGSEGGDPTGIQYEELGPLAFVLNEAVDSVVLRGADRDGLHNSISQAAGDQFSVEDVKDVLAGDVRCPDLSLLQAFGQVTSIDIDIIIDAAQRGGCDGYFGQPTEPPGY